MPDISCEHVDTFKRRPTKVAVAEVEVAAAAAAAVVVVVVVVVVKKLLLSNL